MKILERNNLPDFFLPLPLYASIHIADAICKRGEEFDVFVGIEEKYALQLKALSLDESDKELQKNTGDRRRFGEGSYEDWYKKSRTPFILVHKQTDELAAIIWFGPKPFGKKFPRSGQEEEYEIQNEWHTIAWRSYSLFRGRGMMKNFTKFVMDTYRTKFRDMKLWFIVEEGNATVIRLASELGFEKDELQSDIVPGSVVMVKREGPYILSHKSHMFRP